MNNEHSGGDPCPHVVPRDFKGIWIPREIWIHPDLLPLEKLLWAEIHSLFDREKGGCYASNEYLSKFFNVSVRHISDMISKLKNLYLVVDVKFDGRQRVIAAIHPPEDLGPFSVVSSRLPRTTVPGRMEPQFQAPTNHSSTLSYIYRAKKENKEDMGASAPSAAVSASSKKKKETKPTKISFRDNVTLTQKEHDNLLAEVGEEPLTWMLNKLSAHKSAKGQTYKSDAATMRNGGWVRDALESRRPVASTSTSYAKPGNKMRVCDTGEYTDEKLWEENERRGLERLKQAAAESRKKR